MIIGSQDISIATPFIIQAAVIIAIAPIITNKIVIIAIPTPPPSGKSWLDAYRENPNYSPTGYK